MNKLKNRKFNLYDILIILILAGLVALTVFHVTSHKLLVKSATDLGQSFIYYVKSLANFDETIPNDNVGFLKFDESIIKNVLPIVPEEFGYKFLAVFEMMFNKHFFIGEINNLSRLLNRITYYFLLLGVPLIILYWLYYTSVLFSSNNKPQDKKSKPLILYLTFKKVVLHPINIFLKNLWAKFRSHKYYTIPFILILLYNVNGVSLIFTVLAWYLYFVMSLDFVSLYYLVCKVLICISPLLRPIFWPFWILFIIFLIIKIKIRLGYRKLYDFYDRNNEFINKLGIVTGIYGPPGSGKNQLETAIVTQVEWNMRERAAADMMEIRLEFPDFPFRKVEEMIEELKDSGKCVNKVQIRYAVKKLFNSKNEIFGYKIGKKKNIHYDELIVKTLEEEVLDYSELYFIYISALACATYSIRFDKGLFMDGHFPSLQYDFFHRDLRDESQSVRAKIFDLNQLRLLKQKDPGEVAKFASKDNISLFDSGIIALSEFGKDRGNRYSNLSRESYDTKPSNDGTAACFGVFRHLTTVRNHQYGFIIWDEQKISAFSNAEAAMAETNIYLSNQDNSFKNAVPGFFIETTIINWGREHFTRQVDKYIKIRNDQTLYSYFYLRIAGFFANLSRKLSNIFGYRKIDMKLSGANINGAQEQRGNKGFYLMNKIVFSDRYQTDCYSGFFDTLKLQSTKGINQLDNFGGRVATVKELQKTSGYFADELIDAICSYVEENLNKKKGGKK